MRQASSEVVGAAGLGSGLYAGSSTETNEAMPLENTLAIIETARERRSYPSDMDFRPVGAGRFIWFRHSIKVGAGLTRRGHHLQVLVYRL